MLFNLFRFRKFKIISKNAPKYPVFPPPPISNSFINHTKHVIDDLQQALGDVPNLPVEFKRVIQVQEERNINNNVF